MKTNNGLDYFRVPAALLVIAIHTSPLATWSVGADFFLTRVLARIAVPFFFMVTGHFILQGFLYHSEKSFFMLLRYIRKVSILYGISIILYLPIGIYAGHYKNLTITGLIRMLFFDGTFYHLWYFPACITGVVFVYILSRFMNIGLLTIVSFFLYIIGLFGDSYYGLIIKMPVLEAVYQKGFHIWTYTRNGLFFAPVFLILGAVIGKREKKTRMGYDCMAWLLSFIIMTLEAFTLRYFAVQRHDSMYIMLIPVMIFLYRILISIKGKPSHYLRTIAAWLYILHPALIIVVRGAAKISGFSILTDNSLCHYCFVVLLTVLLSSIIAVILEWRRNSFVCIQNRAWIEIDRDALKNNVAFFQSKLPENCRLMPAIKADAYGHGAILVAGELYKLGIASFCVACIQEGIALRKAGIKGEILILGYTHPNQFDLLRFYHLTQTVVDYAYAEKLRQYQKKLHVHIGIDTGMHRLGEGSENMEQILKIFGIKNLIIDGIFTHLSADDTRQEHDRLFTDQQVQRFNDVICFLKNNHINCPKIHIQSTYGVLNYPELTGDYARIGIGLYGVLSTKADTEKWGAQLKPVMSLKTRVACVRNIHAGETVGYGLGFMAQCPMKIAVLTIGYADGLPRALSNGNGAVLINGQKAFIIGYICMDQTLVDVSNIPDIYAGDIAVVIGKSKDLEITVCDIAEQAGTITNEILSRIGERVSKTPVSAN